MSQDPEHLLWQTAMAGAMAILRPSKEGHRVSEEEPPRLTGNRH